MSFKSSGRIKFEFQVIISLVSSLFIVKVLTKLQNSNCSFHLFFIVNL